MGDWKGVLGAIKRALTSKASTGHSETPAKNVGASSVLSRQQRSEVKRPIEAADSRVPIRITPAAPSAMSSTPRTPDQTLPQESKDVRSNAKDKSQGSVPVSSKNEKTAKSAAVPTHFGVIQGAKLTRQKFFKTPDSWVSEGEKLQHSTGSQTGAVEIVIGIDFGTSFTKAAIGLKDQIFPVSWEGISLFPDPYLLPSEYSELKNGACYVGQAPDQDLECLQHHLKHPFIDPAVSAASVVRAAVYLGLVIRYIRAWVYKFHGKKIGNSPIRWLLNIGAPSNGLEVGRLEEAYRRLGNLAWKCSQSRGRLCREEANTLANSVDSKTVAEGLFDLSVLPEFVGQIAGYVKSAQRKPGLHALVDIGGGTLDVVTFIIHENNGEDVFPFLVPAVEPLGTQMLNFNRFVDGPAHGRGDIDELQPVLDAPLFASCSGLSLAHVEQRDAFFWKEVDRVVHRVLLKTRQKRDPNSEHWKLGLPTFVTGGGANIEQFVTTTKAAGARVAKHLQIMSLPNHPALANFSGSAADYQRISVACGLAMDAMNLGQIKPAKDVEDLVIDRQPNAPRLDHEDIYG